MRKLQTVLFKKISRSVCVCFSVALLSCENDPNEVAKFDASEQFPDQTIHDAELLYSTHGKIDVFLSAPLVHQYGGEEPYNEMPEGVHLIIYDSAMTFNTDLTANYAIDLSHKNKMEAKGNVIVVNEKGEQLNTEHLVWDKKSGKFTSDVFVKITTESQVLMGDGLIANQDFSTYQILKPRGTINLEDE